MCAQQQAPQPLLAGPSTTHLWAIPAGGATDKKKEGRRVTATPGRRSPADPPRAPQPVSVGQLSLAIGCEWPPPPQAPRASASAAPQTASTAPTGALGFWLALWKLFWRGGPPRPKKRQAAFPSLVRLGVRKKRACDAPPCSIRFRACQGLSAPNRLPRWRQLWGSRLATKTARWATITRHAWEMTLIGHPPPSLPVRDQLMGWRSSNGRIDSPVEPSSVHVSPFQSRAETCISQIPGSQLARKELNYSMY